MNAENWENEPNPILILAEQTQLSFWQNEPNRRERGGLADQSQELQRIQYGLKTAQAARGVSLSQRPRE
jgi:hypothetical protein